MSKRKRGKAAKPVKPISALIIDDERPARELIEELLRGLEDIEIVGECADGRRAVAVIEQLQPELIFLDIRMPFLDGFGVLEQLNVDVPPVIVFVTAYDQYAVRAFEVNALDYLLKPIRRQRFSETIARVRKQLRLPPARRTANLKRLLQHWQRGEQGGRSLSQSEFLQRIFVRERRRSISIEVRDIEWVGSLDHFVRIHTRGRAYVLHEKLSALEQKLDPAQFFRIHRTRIVNLAAIESFKINESGSYVTVLRDGSSHRVARSRSRQLQRVLSD